MSACISCGRETASQVRGQIGDVAGVLCGDCAFWCDGNVTAPASAEAGALADYLDRALAAELAVYMAAAARLNHLAACADFQCRTCLDMIAEVTS